MIVSSLSDAAKFLVTRKAAEDSPAKTHGLRISASANTSQRRTRYMIATTERSPAFAKAAGAARAKTRSVPCIPYMKPKTRYLLKSQTASPAASCANGHGLLTYNGDAGSYHWLSQRLPLPRMPIRQRLSRNEGSPEKTIPTAQAPSAAEMACRRRACRRNAASASWQSLQGSGSTATYDRLTTPPPSASARNADDARSARAWRLALCSVRRAARIVQCVRTYPRGVVASWRLCCRLSQCSK